MKILNIVKEEIKSRIINEYNDLYTSERMELRRKNKEWEGENLVDDVLGKEATAVLQHLRIHFDAPDDLTVYDIIPENSEHYMTVFSVNHPDFENMTFISGSVEDTYDTAIENQKNLIEDIGVEELPDWLIDANIDKTLLKRQVDYIVSNMIWESPDEWIDDDSKRNLSHAQMTNIEFLNELVNKYDNEIRELESELGGQEDETIKKIINKYSNLLSVQEEKIKEIENNPQGDYPEEIIEQRIKDMVDDVIHSGVKSIVDDWGIDVKKLVSYEGIAQDIVESDGEANSLNLYDGELWEYKVLDKVYNVGRRD